MATKITPNEINLGAAGGYVATSENINSPSSYIDSTTAGPSITINVGQNGMVLAGIYAGITAASGGYAGMGINVSGANTIAPTDDRAIFNLTTGSERFGATFLYTGLTPGSTTFKAQYKASASGVFVDKRIWALPL